MFENKKSYLLYLTSIVSIMITFFNIDENFSVTMSLIILYGIFLVFLNENILIILATNKKPIKCKLYNKQNPNHIIFTLDKKLSYISKGVYSLYDLEDLQKITFVFSSESRIDEKRYATSNVIKRETITHLYLTKFCTKYKINLDMDKDLLVLTKRYWYLYQGTIFTGISTLIFLIVLINR